MFDKYPEQKQARKWVGAFGVALLVLGVFLIVIGRTGGGLCIFMGSGLVLLVLLANDKQFAKTISVLGWFGGLS
ncbi:MULTISPECIES: hypothetical protein [Pseudomonas]|uniref:Uncharacterized protein n=1 Tax=Pseudomonas fluorescens LMG 5329 TaxID=1324332 RepID=A0A0A1Z447_PSEFL|nr:MULTISPECIES: hypothetical protein [Pseudomonas]KGE68993.1 hypothetical protein K814_0105325 [Pseudomonas fluorescens LMG 5329]NWD99676.1 hypothetical protein [Pseudomonas sp. IPO3749]NWF21383.1 hypothetical protein [Pseudomonas sp. IPO3749]